MANLCLGKRRRCAAAARHAALAAACLLLLAAVGGASAHTRTPLHERPTTTRLARSTEHEHHDQQQQQPEQQPVTPVEQQPVAPKEKQPHEQQQQQPATPEQAQPMSPREKQPTPPYSHMLARPSDAFPEPARGAWVYFVGVNADRRHYLHWALASIQCLQDTGTKWDVVVFYEGTDKTAADSIRKLGARVLLLEEYVRDVSVDLTEFNKRNDDSNTSNGWYHAWNKLLAWTLTEYDKLVVVDSDTVAWTNSDELFLYPEFAAVQDSVWPLMSDEYQQYFNSGVMVIEPSLDTFQRLINGLKTYTDVPYAFWWDASEQTYLNYYFNTSWYHLPISYNYVSFLFAGALAVDWNVKHVKLVHHLRDSVFDVTHAVGDCVKHYCPRCCERLVTCKDTALGRAGIEHVRAERKWPGEEPDEEHMRYMARLGLV